MTNGAFLIAGDHAEVVANDVNDFRYRAARLVLRAGDQVAAQTNERAETQFLIEHGTVEFMVSGASAVLDAGAFVRVRAGQVCAYRNIGGTEALVLHRTIAAPHGEPDAPSGCAA